MFEKNMMHDIFECKYSIELDFQLIIKRGYKTMKNIISILAALSVFLFSATVFAGEGPLALPSGTNPEAKKHNVEGIEHWQQGHYDVASETF